MARIYSRSEIAGKILAMPERVLECRSPNILKRPIDEVSKNNSTSRKRAAKSVRLETAATTATAAASISIPAKQLQIWGIAGSYKTIAVGPDRSPIDTTNYSMKVFFNGMHLFATFKFDTLEGIMRLCRATDLAGTGFHLADFEKKSRMIVLHVGWIESDWLMRWRARDGGMRLGEKVGGEYDIQSGFYIHKDVATSTAEFMGVKIDFVMFYNGNAINFKCVKTADLEEDPCPEMEKEWKKLYNPEWDAEDSDSDSNGGLAVAKALREQASSKAVPAKPKQKPGPKPGSLTKPTSKFIEEPPAWAWNVAGEWILHGPMLAEQLELDSADALTMRIILSNNPYHSKIGRQLWAMFNFGDKVVGCMRLCPAKREVVEGPTLEKFEKSCVLKDGEWVGAPKDGGHLRWALRWRAEDQQTGKKEFCSDDVQTEIVFEKGEDGMLMLKGCMFLRFVGVGFEGRKTGDEVKSANTTVARTWLRYKVRHYI